MALRSEINALKIMNYVRVMIECLVNVSFYINYFDPTNNENV